MQLLARTGASVTDLKKNPMATMASGAGLPVVILNRNEPAFYCVPPQLFESWMIRMEALEDFEDNAIADARAHEPRVAISLDEL